MDMNTLTAAAQRLINKLGFGGVPDWGKTIQFAKGGEEYFIAFARTDAKQALEIKEVSSGHYNAKFIPAIPDRVTLAVANPGVKVLASDNFTGCKYQLWKDKDGQFIGAHAYKGVSKEASIDTEAAGKGWTRVYEFGTAGHLNLANGEQGFAFTTIGVNLVETAIMAVKDGKAIRTLGTHSTSRT